MSAIEDIRQALQDFIAPELRAITARLDAVEQRFQAVDQRFETLIALLNARFDAINTKFESMHSRFDSLAKDVVQVKEYLDIERRLTRLESKQTPVSQ